ncbi:MAG: DUF3786 domain-containing protein [Proteobacteria bacterium]|nr:DUF3786 domain-containing protein [Pseudomonadota bacterium]
MTLELKKQKVYKKVFENACNALLSSHIEKQLHNAALDYEREENRYTVAIPYFDEVITFKVPELSFISSKGVNITLVTKIILLHYIYTASGTSLGVDKIPYEDIPGCRQYQPVFEKRVTKPLQSAFGYNKYAFLEASIGLKGKEEEFGDASFTLYALPRVPITFILWEGDEEFPPSVRTLFDPSIQKYLPLEDIVVISKLASTRIIKEARLKYSF